MVEVLSGKSVTLHCPPSNDSLGLQWTHNAVAPSRGNIDVENLTSTARHQLTIPVADVSDSGNYTCTIRGLPDGITVSQIIVLTVLPGKNHYYYYYYYYAAYLLYFSLWKN